jgi:hypothetical protein
MQQGSNAAIFIGRTFWTRTSSSFLFFLSENRGDSCPSQLPPKVPSSHY